MAEFDITGVGVWSPHFSDWAAFCRGLETGVWSYGANLDPDVIPARERRRAPQSVKMAVEVMGQACRMAEMNPGELATVFSSAMGDMQITDTMCRTLAVHPELVTIGALERTEIGVIDQVRRAEKDVYFGPHACGEMLSDHLTSGPLLCEIPRRVTVGRVERQRGRTG